MFTFIDIYVEAANKPATTSSKAAAAAKKDGSQKGTVKPSQAKVAGKHHETPIGCLEGESSFNKMSYKDIEWALGIAEDLWEENKAKKVIIHKGNKAFLSYLFEKARLDRKAQRDYAWEALRDEHFFVLDEDIERALEPAIEHYTTEVRNLGEYNYLLQGRVVHAQGLFGLRDKFLQDVKTIAKGLEYASLKTTGFVSRSLMGAAKHLNNRAKSLWRERILEDLEVVACKKHYNKVKRQELAEEAATYGILYGSIETDFDACALENMVLKARKRFIKNQEASVSMADALRKAGLCQSP